MKNLLVLSLVIANLFAYTQQTIYDVFNNDRYITYGNKISAIEADSFKILLNSPEDQVKRYYRMRYFLDNRIDNANSLNTYMSAFLEDFKITPGMTPSGLIWQPNIGPIEANMYFPSDPYDVGQTNAVAVNPLDSNCVYLGKNTGGLWKTEHITATPVHWQLVTPFANTGVYGIVFPPNDSNTIYIATGIRIAQAYLENYGDYGLGIFKSTDGGATWANVLSFLPNIVQLKELKMHPTNPNILFALSGRTFYKTTDAGLNWTAIPLPDFNNKYWFHKFAFNTTNPDEIYASGSNCVAYSTDGGLTWLDYTRKFLVGHVAGGAGFFRSTYNGSIDWVSPTTPPPMPTTTINSIYFENVRHGFFVTQGNVYETTYEGESWSAPINLTPNELKSFSYKDGIGITVGVSNTIYRKHPTYGWQDVANGAVGSFNATSQFSDSLALIGGNNGIVYYTTNLKTITASNVAWSLGNTSVTNNINSIYAFKGTYIAYLCGNGGKIMKSTDYGQTWSSQSSGTSFNLNSIYFPATDTGFVCGYNGIIRKTTNGGTNWVALTSGTTVSLNCIYFYDTQEGYACGDNGILLKTVNGGSTWTVITTLVTTENLKAVAFPPLEKRFAVTYNPAPAYSTFYISSKDYWMGSANFLKYDLTLQKWFVKKSFSIPGVNYVFDLEAAPNGVFYSTSQWLYKSSNEFTTITGVSSGHMDKRAICFPNGVDDNLIYVCNDGGIGKILSGTYTSRNGDLCALQFMGIGTSNSDPDYMMGGGPDVGSWLKQSSSTWTHVLNNDGGKCEMSNQDKNYKYGITLGNIELYYSTGSGFTYSGKKLSKADGIITAHPNSKEVVFIESDAFNLLKSSNHGVFGSWDTISFQWGLNTNFAISPANPNIMLNSHWDIWFNNMGRVLKSIDGGNTWDVILHEYNPTFGDLLKKAPTSDIEFHPTDPNKFWLTFGRWESQKVLYTTDGGTSFTDITYNLYNLSSGINTPVNCIFYDVNNSKLYLGTDFGFYFKDDGTQIWKLEIPTVLPKMIISDIRKNTTSNELVISTWGCGIWKADIPCTLCNDLVNIYETQVWSNARKICGSLEIFNNDTLTISDLTICDGNSITVNSGCTLIVNGTIENSNHDPWDGNLIVQSGGTLILNSTANVRLGGNGKILINAAAEHYHGTLEYYPNAGIVLADVNTMLDLKGYLNVNDNADFTFTGNGFISLSGTSLNPATITSGTNASITLNGTGKTDKILEIDQADMFVPYNLTDFTLTNGWVNMKNATASLSITGPSTSITVNNIRFNPLNGTTRTGQRGLWLYGQASCTITNSDFEYGQYGIYGWLTGGSPFTVFGCNFTDNYIGLFYHDKQVQAISCVFSKNYYGFYAEYTTDNNNLIDGCTFSAAPNGNTAPVRYINCTGNILVRNTYITYAATTAVSTTGSHFYNMLCSYIGGVAGSSYGLIISNGASLYMNNSPTLGKNYIIATAPIRLTAANNFNIDYGLNYLNRTTNPTSYHIYGTVTAYPCDGSTPTNSAIMNQWVYSIRNSVKKYACQTQTVTVATTPTTTYTSCGGGSSPQFSPELSLSLITNETYIDGVSSMQSAETTGSWNLPFNSFNQILSGTVPQQTLSDVMLWENSWENMRNCLKEMYSANQLTGTGNSEFAQTIAANEKMQQLQQNNYYRKFQIELEKATLYRMAGDYNTAITLLTPMVNDTAAINSEQAEAWLCIVQLEKQITEGTITPNEIEEARAICPTYTEETTKSYQVTGNENTNSNTNETIPVIGNAPWLYAMPNPISQSSVIAVNTAGDNESIIEITDIFGRLVKSIKVQGGYSEVQIPRSELSKGIYTISLMQNGKKVAVSGMTVIE
ncbi:MAG: hypothetical protein A2X08_03030 [Bacteroidetes bacterium GWA2_32_17]|nr:MAG: hypothetical protein A2X08_03030 [Bacteroidetes bacterium GWA2_32_17]